MSKNQIYYSKEDYNENTQFNSDDEGPQIKESSYVEFEFPKNASKVELTNSQVCQATEQSPDLQ